MGVGLTSIDICTANQNSFKCIEKTNTWSVLEQLSKSYVPLFTVLVLYLILSWCQHQRLTHNTSHCQGFNSFDRFHLWFLLLYFLLYPNIDISYQHDAYLRLCACAWVMSFSVFHTHFTYMQYSALFVWLFYFNTLNRSPVVLPATIPQCRAWQQCCN